MKEKMIRVKGCFDCGRHGYVEFPDGHWRLVCGDGHKVMVMVEGQPDEKLNYDYLWAKCPLEDVPVVFKCEECVYWQSPFCFCPRPPNVSYDEYCINKDFIMFQKIGADKPEQPKVYNGIEFQNGNKIALNPSQLQEIINEFTKEQNQPDANGVDDAGNPLHLFTDGGTVLGSNDAYNLDINSEGESKNLAVGDGRTLPQLCGLYRDGLVSVSYRCWANQHDKCKNDECECNCHENTTSPREATASPVKKEICTSIRYSCPDCEYINWGEGKDIGEPFHCMCNGYWEWDGKTWLWKGQPVADVPDLPEEKPKKKGVPPKKKVKGR